MPTYARDNVLAAMQGRFTDFYSQYGPLHASGGELRGACPIHGGERDSFSVDAKTGKWFCHSHGCGKPGGDIFDFLLFKDGLEFRDALENIASWSGTSPASSAVSTASSAKPKRPPRRILATYDYIDEEGRLLYQVQRKEPKGFSQRKPDGQGGWHYSLGNVRRVLYRLPDVLATVATGKPVYVCEGEKDADALAALGLCATTAAMGAMQKPEQWLEGYTETLCGAGVVILPDNDEAGRDHARLVAEALQGQAKRVRVVMLPGLPEKGDVSDWLAGGGTAERLMQIVKETADWDPKGQELPMVETNGRHLRDESNDALAALIRANSPPAVFVRGGELARVQVNEKNRATIKGLTPPMLRGQLARSANFVSSSEKRGVVPVAPPKDVVEDVLALAEWKGIPPLTGIVTAPVFSADGKMDTRPGYHVAARLFYHETCSVPIPDTTPTAENVAQARSLIIDDLLGDFPFADEASRAHAVALLLLPFVRPMIDAPTPLHLIDAPAAGTGKGLLAKVCTLPFTATGAPVKAPPTEEAEWSKTITSVLSDGDSHLLFDNVRQLNSPSFLAALTSTLYKDRLLSTNRTGEFENRLVWLATANNLQGNDELTRRSIWTRLDAGVERPENREGFRHPDLAEWATANRGVLIGAALTLVRTWIEDGQPSYAGKEKPLGSFEAWTRVMGGILETAGIPGFLENREEQRSRVDTETTTWHGFVEAWQDRHGDALVVPADLFPLAMEWMPEKLGDGTERSQKSKFGRMLVRHIDKVFAGQKIVAPGKITSGPSKNSPQYQLEPAPQQKSGDLGGHGILVPVPRVGVSKEDNILYRGAVVDVSDVSDVSRLPDAEDENDEVLI